MPNSRLCSIEGCGNPSRKRGWCQNHYARWRAHGDPLGGRYYGELASFVERAIEYDGDDCLLWPFATFGKNGRPQIRKDGKPTLVYRIVCKATKGEPPTPKHVAAHSCGNGHLGCITNKHLRWATPAENMADQLLHGTRVCGSAHGRSKLTETQIIEIRSIGASMPKTRLAEIYKVSETQIRRILSLKRWAHVA